MVWSKLLSREGVDITTISGLDIVFYEDIWEFSKRREELFFTYFHNSHFTHLIGVEQQKLGEHLLKVHAPSPAQIIRKYEEGKALRKEIEETTKEWKKKLSVSNLSEAFDALNSQFLLINREYSITPWLYLEAWQQRMDEIVRELLPNKPKAVKEEVLLSSLYSPWKKTALNEIQEKLQKKESPEKLAQEYQFLRSWSLIWNKPLDAAWIRSIAQIKEKEVPLPLDKVIKILKPDKKKQHLLELAPYLTFFKDWRDDLRRYHCYAWQFFWEKLSVLFSVPKDDLGYLTLLEIEDSCRLGKIDRPCIEKRKTVPLVVTAKLPELQMIMKEGPPQQYLTIINSLEKKSKQTVVSGNSAYPGKAVGKVCLIRSYHDVKKVQEGDILIANTTHPNYLPGMKKAAAFITNEGGLISHAAIVAREMKKPCIVGTKIATKCFQDGDMVEVDARSGIVRKVF